MFESKIDRLIEVAVKIEESGERDKVEFAQLRSETINEIDLLMAVGQYSDEALRSRCLIKLINSPDSIAHHVNLLIEKLLIHTVYIFFTLLQHAESSYATQRILAWTIVRGVNGQLLSGSYLLELTLDKIFDDTVSDLRELFPKFKVEGTFEFIERSGMSITLPFKLYVHALNLDMDDRLIKYLTITRWIPLSVMLASSLHHDSKVFNQVCRLMFARDGERYVTVMRAFCKSFSYLINPHILYDAIKGPDSDHYLKRIIRNSHDTSETYHGDVDSDEWKHCLFKLAILSDIDRRKGKVADVPVALTNLLRSTKIDDKYQLVMSTLKSVLPNDLAYLVLSYIGGGVPPP